MYSEISSDLFYEKTLSDKLMVIDVREPDEFLAGHVAGSVNFPLSQLEKNYQDLPQETELYLICKSGMRSMRAGHFLAEKGLEVVGVQGGVEHYSGELVKEK